MLERSAARKRSGGYARCEGHVSGKAKHQVTTAPVRGTTDARDPGVQKKTVAGNGVVMARAG